jgi:hypothetical protein
LRRDGAWLTSDGPAPDRIKNAKGRVLVHCSAGKSRSPTIVMAYLIRRERSAHPAHAQDGASHTGADHGAPLPSMTMRDAYEYVKTKRAVNPNLGFLIVLAEYERSTWTSHP